MSHIDKLRQRARDYLTNAGCDVNALFYAMRAVIDFAEPGTKLATLCDRFALTPAEAQTIWQDMNAPSLTVALERCGLRWAPTGPYPGAHNVLDLSGALVTYGRAHEVWAWLRNRPDLWTLAHPPIAPLE